MAAISARSNAISPNLNSPEALDRGIRQSPSPFPFGTAEQEYSRDQLARFIQEARQQAKIGASPRKISVHYKFLDSDDNPRFSPSTIAEWIAMPASGIAAWLEANKQAHVTLRRDQMTATFGHRSPPSRSQTPTSAFDDLGRALEQARQHLPACTSATAPDHDDARPMTAARAAASAAATVAAARAAAALAAAKAAAAAAAAAEAEEAAEAAETAAAVATGAPAPAARPLPDTETFCRRADRCPDSESPPSRAGSPGAASLVESLHRPQIGFTAAPTADPYASASAGTYSLPAHLVEALLQQHVALNARMAEWCQPPGPQPVLPSTPPPTPKPFKDFLPNLPPYSGDGAPEAFLAQFRTQARHLEIPPQLLPRQLIAKLTGDALTWFNLRFAGQDTTVTLEEIALALRNEFGQEYAGARAFRDMWHIPMDFTLGGAQRLRLMNQLEERARQLRVPLAPGPCECRYYRLLEGVSPSESQRLFSEFTANPRCSEKALRQLEEAADHAGHPTTGGASRDSLLSPVNPAREALFALRVELTEAFLHRILSPGAGSSRDRPARVLRASGHPVEPSSPGTAPQAPPTPRDSEVPLRPNPAVAADTAECRLLSERLEHIDGRGFKGPPQYFGPNSDSDTKKRNQAEFSRRRNSGLCFKCTMSDVTACPFIECPRHGAAAVRSGAAASAASVRRPRLP